MSLGFARLDDPVLPQLAEVLDEGRMAKVFAGSLFSSGANDPDRYSVSICNIGRIKYKAGERCSIGYQLTIRDRKMGREAEQLLCGRIYERGGSLARYRKARTRPLATPVFGPALFHVPELEMIVWAFPNDRKLGGLRILTDDTRLREQVLPDLVKMDWGADWHLEAFSRELASYVPEGRCTMRFDLSLVKESTREERCWTIFGKSHYEDARNARAYRALELLWDYDARQGCARSPRPLAYQAPLQLYWQEAIEGRTRLGLRAEGSAVNDLYATAATAIADLHRAPIEFDRELTLQHVVDHLRRTAKSLSESAYGDAPDLLQIVGRLIESAPCARPNVRATLHGDLHPGNIYFDGDRMSFIDLDDLSRGAPEFDIGSLFARVLNQAVIDGDPPEKALAPLQSFFQAYCRRAPWPMSAASAAWYTAAALVRERAFRGWAQLKSGWQEVNDELIRLADKISRSEGHALGLTDCDAA